MSIWNISWTHRRGQRRLSLGKNRLPGQSLKAASGWPRQCRQTDVRGEKADVGEALQRRQVRLANNDNVDGRTSRRWGAMCWGLTYAARGSGEGTGRLYDTREGDEGSIWKSADLVQRTICLVSTKRRKDRHRGQEKVEIAQKDRKISKQKRRQEGSRRTKWRQKERKEAGCKPIFCGFLRKVKRGKRGIIRGSGPPTFSKIAPAKMAAGGVRLASGWLAPGSAAIFRDASIAGDAVALAIGSASVPNVGGGGGANGGSPAFGHSFSDVASLRQGYALGTLFGVGPVMARAVAPILGFALLPCWAAVRASGELLVSLSLTRVTLAFLDGRLPRPNFIPDLFLRTGIPHLRFLRLRGATVGWDGHRYYPRLEVLIVQDLPPLICFTALQLYFILASSCSLMYLSLPNVSCDALPPYHHAFFSCMYILELDLYLNGTLGVPDVLSRCDMPSLRKLTLILESEFDLRCLLACSFLERVVVMSLEAPNFPREALTDLWSRMPSIVDLDIGRAGFTAFDALYSPDGLFDCQHLCPKLRRLFLERRTAAGLILDHLTMFRVADFFERAEADIDWLSNTLGAEQFQIDPDCELSVTPRWTEH
ncbi:hypothetical protein C8F04DRAFT_1176787 [Mycena alexandri]|uniref:Uncharacterized protein n=1 Tax=Mycena alexandri TaxID=1745969 RepID=A0AAD6XAW5_9AGAR|nr:hypothetical protein C8F04DRAFT_1176787 [Mycena alexandri]